MKTKKWLGFIALFALFMGLVLPHQANAASSSPFLTSLDPSDSTGYYTDWNDEAFKDSAGKNVSNGFGLKTYSAGDESYVSYDVEGQNYTHIQGKVTLDSRYLQGDYGKTAVGFYADDRLVYEKQMNRTSSSQSYNVALPKNTKTFSIVIMQLDGSKGTHLVVIQDAKFIKTGSFLNVADTQYHSALSIGASDREYYYITGDTKTFRDINGNIITKGFQLHSYDSGSAYAAYNVNDTGYNVFETSVSLDSNNVTGDYGKTVVGIYADSYLLYEKELSSKTPVQQVKVNIPKNTSQIKIVAQQLKGAKGTHSVTFNQPVFKTVGSSFVSVPYTTSPQSIGADDSNMLLEDEPTSSDYVTHYANGSLGSSSILLKGITYEPSYAQYNISDTDVNVFKAKLSLDYESVQGDHGSSVVKIFADNKQIFAKTIKKSTTIENLALQIPARTKYFKVTVDSKAGAKGTQNILFGNPVFQKLPASGKLSSSRISVENNYNKDDIVTVRSITKGDVIKVYNSKGTLLATSKPATTNYTKVAIKQLGTGKGTILVSRISPNKAESGTVSASFAAEPAVSSSISAQQTTIVNNKGKNDTITVKSLTKGDKVKVYDAKGTLIATSGAAAKDSVVISVKQLGTGKGTVYLTRLTPNKLESGKTAVSYAAEPVTSSSLSASRVTIENNRNKDDVITVKSLYTGDVVKVYNSQNKLIATSKPATTYYVKISVKQLGKNKGNVLLTRTSSKKLESTKISVPFKAE